MQGQCTPTAICCRTIACRPVPVSAPYFVPLCEKAFLNRKKLYVLTIYLFALAQTPPVSSPDSSLRRTNRIPNPDQLPYNCRDRIGDAVHVRDCMLFDVVCF